MHKPSPLSDESAPIESPMEWLIQSAYEGAHLADSELHGDGHWRAVAQAGLMLAEADDRIDPEVVLAFAILHDCRRHNDEYDPQHGDRAAELVRELERQSRLSHLTATQIEQLTVACEHHHQNVTSIQITIGACFDADRLNLPRVGIAPSPDWLSTRAARSTGMMHACEGLHGYALSWKALDERRQQIHDQRIATQTLSHIEPPLGSLHAPAAASPTPSAPASPRPSVS